MKWLFQQKTEKMKKYEFIFGDNIKIGNKTLYRIKALIDIPSYFVKKGDLGGYVQYEYNLSHDGDCWVGNDAAVYGYAQISGNAQIYGNAHVFGNAIICDKSRVCGYALVYDNANVYGNAHIYDNAKVFGNAEVYGKERVYGNDKVYSCDELFGKSAIMKWLFTAKQEKSEALTYKIPENTRRRFLASITWGEI